MADPDLPPDSPEPDSEHGEAFVIQTKLEQHGFTAVPRYPCWINRMLPSELIMEIFAYLPAADDCPMTRVHSEPSDIPIHHSDFMDVEEDKKGQNDLGVMIAREDSDYGNCIAQALFPEGCTHYCSSGHWNYLDILRVCRFWYSCAMSNPHFWTHIPSQSLGTVYRSLTLSGALPIFAVADHDHQWPSELAFTAVLQHLPRVCNLDITYATRPRHPGTRLRRARWNIKRVLHPFTSLHAPNLRVLKLLHWNRKSLDTEHWLERTFPSLEILHLRSFEILAPCTLFAPTLTELNLSDCSTPWTTTEQLLLCLSKMSSLQRLELQDTPLPPDLEFNNFSLPMGLKTPIRLSHVHHLWLEGSFRSVNRLLSMLDISRGTTTLYLSFEGGYRPEDSADRQKTHNFISSFPAFMPSDACFTSVDLDADFDNRLVNLTFGDPKTLSNKRCAEEVQLRIEWGGDEITRAPQMIDFLFGMVEALFTNSRQTELSYRQSGFYPGSRIVRRGPDVYLAPLNSLTDVSVLRLTKDVGAGAFIQWMMSQRRRGSFPFPATKRLSINDVDLREKVRNRALGANVDDILYAQLWVYLHYQQPRALSLTGVDASPRMLAELRRIVPSVDIYGGRRVQERERFRVYRDSSGSRELLYIHAAANSGEGQRRLLRSVDAPKTEASWRLEQIDA